MGLVKPKPQNPNGPQIINLEKGQILFNEGENSRSMYFVKHGVIRIFKRKGNSDIEIGTIHSGQVLGELAFLDGQPRSASGEALTNCTLIEISGQTFIDTLGKMPDWLKLLLKTVVGRLRAASTKIRQLEQASTSFDYSSDGKRSSHYVYLSPPDILKISSSILLVASRNGKETENGIKIKPSTIERYANNIMGVPVAKITTSLDVFAECGIVDINAETGDLHLLKPDLLEEFIIYFNSENLLEPSKRHDISIRGFLILQHIAKQIDNYKENSEGNCDVNIAEIKKKLEDEEGKEPFRLDEFAEISKAGYGTQLNILSDTEAVSVMHKAQIKKSYEHQRIIKALESANEKKGHRR